MNYMETKRTYETMNEYYQNLTPDVKMEVDTKIADRYYELTTDYLIKNDIDEDQIDKYIIMEEIESEVILDIEPIFSSIELILSQYPETQNINDYDELFSQDDYSELLREMIHENTFIERCVDNAIVDYIDSLY